MTISKIYFNCGQNKSFEFIDQATKNNTAVGVRTVLVRRAADAVDERACLLQCVVETEKWKWN